MRRSRLFWLIFITLVLVAPVSRGASAQGTDRLCFSQTGQCIEGRFRAYWEQNGGLPVFGYPVTPARQETNPDTRQSYLTQWFERNRFELHPENAAPYDVLLGRLGDDRLRQLGVDWQREPKNNETRPDCLDFPQTGHKVCDMAAGLGFRTYWQTHGLRDPRLDPAAQSLALFGLPLTEPRMETNASGDRVLTQWFERARFEWHPNNPDAYKVLLGLLGTEVRAGAGRTPAPVPTLEYTALGDSLATGVLASKGYVPRYRDYIQADTGQPVQLNALGRNGWTSSDLLNALRTNQTFRAAISRSHVVTWDIGGNDFLTARGRYRTGRCGGADNQDCLRSGLAAFKTNWNAIMAEILSLRRTSNTIIRTMDTYNPFVAEDQAADSWAQDGGRNDFQVFKPYIDDANSHIASTATANNIPYAQVYRAFNGPRGDEDPSAKGYITFDGVHPSDRGHTVIADLLRGLRYAPLK